MAAQVVNPRVLLPPPAVHLQDVRRGRGCRRRRRSCRRRGRLRLVRHQDRLPRRARGRRGRGLVNVRLVGLMGLVGLVGLIILPHPGRDLPRVGGARVLGADAGVVDLEVLGGARAGVGEAGGADRDGTGRSAVAPGKKEKSNLDILARFFGAH